MAFVLRGAIRIELGRKIPANIPICSNYSRIFQYAPEYPFGLSAEANCGSGNDGGLPRQTKHAPLERKRPADHGCAGQPKRPQVPASGTLAPLVRSNVIGVDGLRRFGVDGRRLGPVVTRVV